MVGGIAFASGGASRMVTTKTYDSLNRLTSIVNQPSATSAVSFAYQYNQANQRTQSSLSDGTYWDYGYDLLGQVTNGVRRWISDNSIVSGQNYEYAFDDIGNRRFTTQGGTTFVSSVYTANLLNQYTQRTVPGVIEVMGSAASNATVTVNLQPTDRHAYPAGTGDAYFHASIPVSNESAAVYQNVTVTAVLKNAGTNQQNIVSETSGTSFVPKTPETFGYDLDGNLTSDGRWAYSWDAENRLIAMQTDTNKAGTAVPAVRIEFAYDAQSRRIGKTTLTGWTGAAYSTTNTTVFVYDGWNLVSEAGTAVPGGPSCTNLYAWGLDLSGSMQGAGGIGGLLFANIHPLPLGEDQGEGSTVFPCYDGNGNVAALISASDGTTAATYEYSPFGETIRATGPLAERNPYRFSTKYTDDKTGLVYYGYRYYSPNVGRWLSRDPMEELGGENLYVFVFNAPQDFVDALGLLAVTPPTTTTAEDAEALALLRLIHTALQASGDRPITALLFGNYLNRGGNMTLPDWAIDTIEANNTFKNQKNAVLAAIIRANGAGQISHMDSGFPRNARFGPSEGDLFSAFHDIQFAVGMRGCITGSGSDFRYDGSLLTKYNDWWGFSITDTSGRYVGGRQPFAAALADFVRSHPRLSRPFLRWINMQEYRFVALQNRGWVQAFTVDGRRFEPRVLIVVSGGTATVTPAPPPSGGYP
jgi:RHS repeat-associated protein